MKSRVIVTTPHGDELLDASSATLEVKDSYIEVVCDLFRQKDFPSTGVEPTGRQEVHKFSTNVVWEVITERDVEFEKTEKPGKIKGDASFNK